MCRSASFRQWRSICSTDRTRPRRPSIRRRSGARARCTRYPMMTRTTSHGIMRASCAIARFGGYLSCDRRALASSDSLTRAARSDSLTRAARSFARYTVGLVSPSDVRSHLAPTSHAQTLITHSHPRYAQSVRSFVRSFARSLVCSFVAVPDRADRGRFRLSAGRWSRRSNPTTLVLVSAAESCQRPALYHHARKAAGADLRGGSQRQEKADPDRGDRGEQSSSAAREQGQAGSHSARLGTGWWVLGLSRRALAFLNSLTRATRSFVRSFVPVGDVLRGLTTTVVTWGEGALIAQTPKREIVVFGADGQKFTDASVAMKRSMRSDGPVTLVLERESSLG